MMVARLTTASTASALQSGSSTPSAAWTARIPPISAPFIVRPIASPHASTAGWRALSSPATQSVTKPAARASAGRSGAGSRTRPCDQAAANTTTSRISAISPAP